MTTHEIAAGLRECADICGYQAACCSQMPDTRKHDEWLARRKVCILAAAALAPPAGVVMAEERAGQMILDDSPLHLLWGKAVGQPSYDKQEWKALEAKLHSALSAAERARAAERELLEVARKWVYYGPGVLAKEFETNSPCLAELLERTEAAVVAADIASKAAAIRRP